MHVNDTFGCVVSCHLVDKRWYNMGVLSSVACVAGYLDLVFNSFVTAAAMMAP